MWFIHEKIQNHVLLRTHRSRRLPVILIVLQILVEMCLSDACNLINSLINRFNHAGIMYTLIFNYKIAFDLPRDVCYYFMT